MMRFMAKLLPLQRRAKRQHQRRPRLEPANSIILDLGGYDAVAGKMNLSLHCVYRWAWPSDVGGCNGYIPRWHHDELIKLGRIVGKPISQARLSLPPDVYAELPKRVRAVG